MVLKLSVCFMPGYGPDSNPLTEGAYLVLLGASETDWRWKKPAEVVSSSPANDVRDAAGLIK